MKQRRRYPAAILLLAFTVAACTEALPLCPSVDVQSPLSSVTVFGPGPARDASNVRYQIAITDVALKCEYSALKVVTGNVDGSLADNLEVLMRIYFTAVRGPAASPGEIEVPYFIAVTDLRDSILSREEFPLRLTLPQTRSSTVQREENWLYFALGGKTGRFFKIQTGFQLSPDQQEFNRRSFAN